MKATITHDGWLHIFAEYGLESYAINKWCKDNLPEAPSNATKISITLCNKEDTHLAVDKDGAK